MTLPFSQSYAVQVNIKQIVLKQNILITGVIGGIVSYLIAYTVTKALDYGSSKTNGLFGYNVARKDVEEIDGPRVRQQTFRIHPNKTADDASDDSSQDAKVEFWQIAYMQRVCLTAL